MKKNVLLFMFMFWCISNAQDNSEEYLILDPIETRYDCHSALDKDNGFIIYADIDRPLKGLLAVGLTFDSIKNPEEPVRILSVQPQWIRLKDTATDSLLLNQSLYDNKLDGELLFYCVELLEKIKECNCVITYYNKHFVPLKVGCSFSFTILPKSNNNECTQ